MIDELIDRSQLMPIIKPFSLNLNLIFDKEGVNLNDIETQIDSSMINAMKIEIE